MTSLLKPDPLTGSPRLVSVVTSCSRAACVTCGTSWPRPPLDPPPGMFFSFGMYQAALEASCCKTKKDTGKRPETRGNFEAADKSESSRSSLYRDYYTTVAADCSDGTLWLFISGEKSWRDDVTQQNVGARTHSQRFCGWTSKVLQLWGSHRMFALHCHISLCPQAFTVFTRCKMFKKSRWWIGLWWNKPVI